MRVDRRIHSKTIDKIVEALDQGLTLEENVQMKIVDVTTPTTADVEFTVTHSLNRKPKIFFSFSDQPAIIYASRKSAWTQSQLFLKCNMESVSATIIVL